MWNRQKVSVVFPVYNEEQGIRKAINDFFATGVVDEVVAVDNNSRDKSVQEIKATKARLVEEKRQGYGFALQRGLREAKGDIIITAEPDGTFVAKDVFKLLVYSDDFDAVFGSRTAKELIWSGANMGHFLRLGNWFIAKVLEYTHNGPSLTDVGCTLKLIKKPVLQKIISMFTVGGSAFSPEFMILCVKSKFSIVEIPVNYRSRVGESKITGSLLKAFFVGLKMISLVIKYRFRKI